jgi:hypothetical protein
MKPTRRDTLVLSGGMLALGEGHLTDDLRFWMRERYGRPAKTL